MIITQFDHPTTAEEARQISLANKEDSRDRACFREIMKSIRFTASVGYTRYQTCANTSDYGPSEHVCNVLRSMGYKVTVKRAYQYDEKKKDWSDKPLLNFAGREQFFAEITWG